MRQFTSNHDQQPMGNGRMRGTETINSVPHHSHQPDTSEGWRMTSYQHYISPTGGGQPREDEARAQATTAINSYGNQRMRGMVTNHCVHHPWIKMSGKICRDSSFQELYYRVRKPRTETESNVMVILAGENRRDSDKPERY